MIFEWPQIVWAAGAFLGLVIHLSKSGQPTGVKFDPGMALARIAIWTTVLYFGGFFTAVRP